MAKNLERRQALMDAGLILLATEGARGVSHRKIDAAAGLPLGTCVNYFKTRDALFEAMGTRIFARLTPSPDALAADRAAPPSRARLAELMHALMARVLAQPMLQIALLELRLESTRRPALRAGLTATLAAALQLDIDFHAAADLPGGRTEVVLLHLAMEGLILNTLTLPEVLDVAGRDAIVDQLVERLVPPC